MSKKNTRILLVDDEEIVRESLSGWLEKDGYTIGTAPDGLEGLKAVDEAPWSILLVDLKMPGIDGLEVLRRVKAKSPETAVVIMTAYATVDTAVNAMKLGAFDYIVKPFDPEEAQPHGREDRRAAGARAGERDPAKGAQARVPVPRPRHESRRRCRARSSSRGPPRKAPRRS